MRSPMPPRAVTNGRVSHRTSVDHSFGVRVKRYQHVLPGLKVAATERMDPREGR
jgi:hypothetical protein